MVLLTLLYLSDPDWIRTNDPHLRRMTLYPAELPNLLGAQNKEKFTEFDKSILK